MPPFGIHMYNTGVLVNTFFNLFSHPTSSNVNIFPCDSLSFCFDIFHHLPLVYQGRRIGPQKDLRFVPKATQLACTLLPAPQNGRRLQGAQSPGNFHLDSAFPSARGCFHFWGLEWWLLQWTHQPWKLQEEQRKSWDRNESHKTREVRTIVDPQMTVSCFLHGRLSPGNGSHRGAKAPRGFTACVWFLVWVTIHRLWALSPPPSQLKEQRWKLVENPQRDFTHTRACYCLNVCISIQKCAAKALEVYIPLLELVSFF